MKRIGNLFEKAFSRENLYQAYLDARKGKRKKRACHRFEINLGANLEQIYQEIHAGIYQPRPYFKFIVHEPKKRTIYAPAFRDIVVQHAIYCVIYDIFDRSFIHTSFACRKGYGTHRASAYIQKALKDCDNDAYILKLDVRKFFYSINRPVLRKLIERKIKDKRFLDIMMLFAEYEESVGIPIGNLLSQIYALIYLNPLDHFIKRVLKVKHYIRYVDDLVLVGLNRLQCLHYRNIIIDIFQADFVLQLSKSTIQKVKKGVNFVGYRTWKTFRLIRKYSLYKFKQCIKKNRWESIISLLGHAKDTASLLYMKNILKEVINAETLSVPKNHRRIYNACCSG